MNEIEQSFIEGRLSAYEDMHTHINSAVRIAMLSTPSWGEHAIESATNFVIDKRNDLEYLLDTEKERATTEEALLSVIQQINEELGENLGNIIVFTRGDN